MFAEDAYREVSGEPDGTEEQNHAKQHLRSDGRSSGEGRLDGCDEDSRAHKSEHCSESHCDGQQRSENGGEDHLHRSELAAMCGSREEDSAIASKAERMLRCEKMSGRLSAAPTSHRPPGWSRWDSPDRT